jgi:dipeptidyl aminopeptidase/acylaminoacyl peptidase
LTRRHRWLGFLGVAVAALCLCLLPGLLAAADEPAKLDDLFRIRNIDDAQISPAGDRVAYVLSEIDAAKNKIQSNIWLIASAGGTPLRLTTNPGRDLMPRWSPDGKLIAFLSDRDGSNQIWLIHPDGGEAVKPLSIEGGVSHIAWSPDGKKIAFLALSPKPAAAEKSPKEDDEAIVYDADRPGLQLFAAEIASGKAIQLTHDSSAVVDFSWSPDGEEIAFAAQPSPRIPDLFRTDLFLVDLRTLAVRDLVKREGIDTFPRFSPDGRQVAFMSTDGSTDWIANWYLCLVPASGGAPRNITPKFDEFMFTPMWSPDGSKVLFLSPQGLRNQLYSVSAENGALSPLLSGDRVWENFSFSNTADRMAFLGGDASTPREVFTSKTDPFSPVRLTFSNPELQGIKLGVEEVVHWKSPDGLKLEGLLLLPRGYIEGTPLPLLTYVHGGPSGRFEASFSPQIGFPYPVQAECYPLQVFSGLGYAVFMPNPRGSYGYGEKFRKADRFDWGGGDYRDIMSGIDALVARRIADPERLGIMGRSYGGYMTGWIISQTARFKAACLGAGMSNLVSFYGETDIPGFMEYYWGNVPWRALDLYMRHSPISFAQNIKTPTLILHGEKDFRVPVPQAQELYRALKRNGVPVHLIIYPRQGHVAAEPKFMKDMMERSLEWFRRWVK